MVLLEKRGNSPYTLTNVEVLPSIKTGFKPPRLTEYILTLHNKRDLATGKNSICYLERKSKLTTSLICL